MFKKIYHVLALLSVLAVIIVPSIVINDTLLPYHLMKWLIITGLVTATAILGLYQAAQDKKALYTHKIFAVLLAVIIIRLMTGILGDDPFKSFWGDGLRLTGTTMWILGMTVTYGLAVYLSTTPQHRARVYWMMVLSGVIAASTGWLIQYNSGLFGVTVGTEGIAGRFIGLLGNATYFAAHSMMASFGGLALLHEKISRPQRLLAMILTAFVIVTVVVAKTRAASIGLVVGLGVYGFYWLLSVRSRVIKLMGISAIVVLVAVSSLYTIAQRQFFGTLYSASHALFSVETLGNRYYLWDIGIQGFLAHPILGNGPENYEITFDRHYNPAILETSRSLSETWGERPHNLFIEYASGQGIIGLAGLLTLLAIALTTAYQTKQGSGYVLGGMIAAYSAYGFFTFDTPSLLMFLFLGLGVLASYHVREYAPAKNRASLIYLVMSGWLLLFLVVGIVIPARAAYEGGSSEDSVGGVYGIYQRDSLKLISDGLINTHSHLPETLSYAVAQELYPLFETATAKDPQLFSLELRKAQIAGIIAAYTKDSSEKDHYTQLATEGFVRARSLSPGRQVVDLAEVRMLLDVGDIIAAQKFSDQIEKNGKATAMFLYLQALVEAANGHTTKAAQFMARAVDDGFVPTRVPSVVDYIIALLETNQDYAHIVAVIQSALTPDDMGNMLEHGSEYQLKLAYALANIGRYPEARAAASSALEKNPTLQAEVSSFINILSKANH